MAASDPQRPSSILPPPPLASEEEHGPTRLHWVTAVLVMLITGAVQWGLVNLIGLAWQRSGAGAVVYTGLLNFIWSGGTGLGVGLGAVLADRLASTRRSRAVRWAIGMGLGGLLVNGIWFVYHAWPVSQAQHAGVLLALLQNAAFGGLGYALLGLVLGLAARLEHGAEWRLPVLGLVGSLAPSTIMLLFALTSGAVTPPAGQWETISLSLAAAGVRGALIGAAFAVGLALGRRQKQRASRL